MSAAEILARCGFASAADVARAASKHGRRAPGAAESIETGEDLADAIFGERAAGNIAGAAAAHEFASYNGEYVE